MHDPRIDKLAAVLLDHSCRVAKGEKFQAVADKIIPSAEEAQKTAEQTEIRQTLSQIAALQNAGRGDEAGRLANDLAGRGDPPGTVPEEEVFAQLPSPS